MEKIHAKGLCHKHYIRLRRHGHYSSDKETYADAPLDVIRNYLSYNPETGAFRWIKRTSTRGGAHHVKARSVAGTIKKDGRRQIRFLGKFYPAARLAWFFVHGEMPPEDIEIDHKNVNPGDDRIANLRLATSMQNKANSFRKNGAASGFKGVYSHPDRPGYYAKINVNGKRIYLGSGSSPEAMAMLYDDAARKHFGDFANTNFKRGQDYGRAA
jgi:hypothetical protein